jgi:hypothetical protein
VGPPSQTTQVKVLKKQFGLHHWIGLVEYIKIHIQNVQFGVRMKEIWLLEDLHAAEAVRPPRPAKTG